MEHVEEEGVAAELTWAQRLQLHAKVMFSPKMGKTGPKSLKEFFNAATPPSPSALPSPASVRRFFPKKSSRTSTRAA